MKAVAKDAASCTLCPLYRNATQTVFGEGRTSAAIMLVGEQPGDQEDRSGDLLALGVTAAVALTGRSVVLSRERGKVIEFMDEQRGMVTAHPSSILRMPDQDARHAAFAGLVKDLKAAMKHATG